MRYPTRRLLLAVLSMGLVGPAMAETLHCRSINGNVTCAGSGASSCQTVNGRTTCVSGGGGVVQQFGSARSVAPPEALPEATDDPEDRDGDDRDAVRRRADRLTAHRSLSIERRSPGSALSLQREGTRLRLRTERMAADPD